MNKRSFNRHDLNTACLTRRASLLSLGYAMAALSLSGCAQSQRSGLTAGEVADADQNKAARAVTYGIEVSLDTDDNRMEQAVVMNINNGCDKDLDAVFLRYYPYGYVPYLVQEQPEANEGKSAAIISVTREGSTDELPYECAADDNTVIKVDLSNSPLKAGESLALRVSAWTDLPIGKNRFGTAVFDEGKLFSLTFCFPYLEYMKSGEWFLDPASFVFENRNPELADYHVTVEAPDSFTVVGPGTVQRDGTLTTIDAKDLRDLAVFASDCMGVDTFEVQGISIDNCYLRVGDVENYRMLSKQYLTDAFDGFIELVGPYHRDRFTLVEGCSNMEFSGIAIVNGDFFYDGEVEGYQDRFAHLVHEVGHQWFYDAVGNHEYREGWIDEGFTTYLTDFEIACRDCESLRMLSELYPEGNALEESIAKHEMERAGLAGDLVGRDHYYLNSLEDKESIVTVMGIEREFLFPGQLPDHFYPTLFLAQLKEAMGDEGFFGFVRDVYETYLERIADTEGIKRMLLEHDDSEKVNELASFYLLTDE